MVCIGAAANPQHRRAFPCHELRLKTTPRPRATKARGAITPSKPRAAPLTEAEERILKAVDVTRVLHKHKEAKDRDVGFAVLLVHLNAAYKAPYRHSNRDAQDPVGKAQSGAFNAAHKRWLKAQAAWRAIEGKITFQAEGTFFSRMRTFNGTNTMLIMHRPRLTWDQRQAHGSSSTNPTTFRRTVD